MPLIFAIQWHRSLIIRCCTITANEALSIHLVCPLEGPVAWETHTSRLVFLCLQVGSRQRAAERGGTVWGQELRLDQVPDARRSAGAIWLCMNKVIEGRYITSRRNVVYEASVA